MAEAKAGAGSPKRVRVRFRSAGDLRDAFVKDISRGGMFLRVPPEWPLGERLIVALELPDKSLLELHAEVVHRQPAAAAGEGPKAGLGVSFLDLDSGKLQRIETYLADAIDGRGGARKTVDFETRITREVSLQEIARRVQARLERIEDVAALPELHSGEGAAAEGARREGSGGSGGVLDVEFDPFAGHSTRPVDVLDADVLRNLEDELTLVERGRTSGSAYDVLGVKPSASLEEVQGVYRARLSALGDEKVGALSPALEERIAAARADVEHAFATISDAERRATLDVNLKILRPSGRTRGELDAHRQELGRRRDAAPPHERADWVRAEPLAHEARTAMVAGDHAGARRAVRSALLYDPYNTELHDLLDQIELVLDMEDAE
ncbi:MAG TPA: PilZ domain-containing protein [Myxococcota bacterium]|jgi:Tfp pilus assembly protein PilZ|nr:PilZ domain-containing protein [Myxococcota bacterium]